MLEERIRNPDLAARVMGADEAAARIGPGMGVAMSGFTGAGYPKAVPQALARRMAAVQAEGGTFQVRVMTGASTAPELDGALAQVKGVQLRLPYQSDPILRERINAGEVDYVDMHLSHVAQSFTYGFYGDIDVAVVEVAGILPDGRLIPSTSIGNNKTWLDRADRVILEVNRALPLELDGMHDVYYGTQPPPGRTPLPLVEAGDRIGEPWLRCDPAKVVAVVETDAPDRNSPFAPPDATSQAIAGHLVEFLRHEVAKGRLPKTLLPLQSGVGNTANAVMYGLADAGFSGLSAFTEVLQDGMLDLVQGGVIDVASATALSFSPDALARFRDNIDFFRSRIVLRSQGISNHPELIRRLGCLAMNAMIEADIYGNVNSTHIMGSKMQNGIGGSGDFARNGYLSFFLSPSTAKRGAISAIVPMVSHVDHTEHDVAVIVTEQGLADLRGLAPRQRAKAIIANCAHPDFRDALTDYTERAWRASFGRHTPHLLDEALSWHQRFVETGNMRPG
ncbi:acetyl-CoA hydrolase/transferase family protein [Coralloluteibacterium thermophilus]|uniref:Acetyl-CoA hydrolase/transferase family protein n=1 Tax=Coralloluteibacterium thermophilum TaxID=2707049 RepID=A0ABV9NIL3_9GAMM